MRKFLEYVISWKFLKIFAQKSSDDDLELTMTYCNGKIKFAFRDFIWEEFMELVEDIGAKVNKCI